MIPQLYIYLCFLYLPIAVTVKILVIAVGGVKSSYLLPTSVFQTHTDTLPINAQLHTFLTLALFPWSCFICVAF